MFSKMSLETKKRLSLGVLPYPHVERSYNGNLQTKLAAASKVSGHLEEVLGQVKGFMKA